MIPILYESNETKFESNGLGLLVDCTRCVVSEERNGSYEVVFEYPVSGALFDELKVGRFVGCTHDDNGDVQPFIIYKREVPDVNGLVNFYGYHISYLLSNVVVRPYAAPTVASAMSGLKTHAMNNNPFSFWTNKPDVKRFEFDTPRLVRNILGGEENSLLDVYGGGEYEFDKFEVRLFQDRGKDSGVTISYGVNLSNLSQEIDNAGTYNAVAPFWKSPEDEVVYLPEGLVIMDEAQGSRIDALPLDLTDKFEERPSVEELREVAKNAIKSGKAWRPTENLKVNFVQLWQTEEYADYADLQRVSLCDTVTVYYPVLGISEVKQKVIKVDYDVLLDRYESIELGTLQSSYGQTIQSAILEIVPTKEKVADSIRYESDLLRGGLGGYVVMPPGENRYPEEILIMDSPDKATAQNVWRWNKRGIGYSPNGYGGPFTTAWTIDGKFVADFIQAGTLSDSEGKNSWNLESGQLVTRELTAIEKLYVDGGPESFFKIPYYADADKDDSEGYLELSSAGLIIKNGKTLIGDTGMSTLDYVDNIPSPDIDGIGGLSFEFDRWETNISPIGVDASCYYPGTDPDTKYSTTIYPGSIEISKDEGGYFCFDTASPYYYMEVGTGDAALFIDGEVEVTGRFVVDGTKNRAVETENYSKRLQYCYETASPLFGDIGQATIDEDGLAFVEIDDIFSETIAPRVEYQVFLQKEGEGDCWISEKTPRYFVIEGTPGLRVAWELKAKQRDYEMERLEPRNNGLEEYSNYTNDIDFSALNKEEDFSNENN